jgi:hypothetical protein
MKKFIISALVFVSLLFCFIPVCTGTVYITTGSGFFAYSEPALDQALYYFNKGQYGKLWPMVDSGIIKIFPAGMHVQRYRFSKNRNGDYKVRVYVSGTHGEQITKGPPDGTLWWTTRSAIVKAGRRSLK